MTDKPRLGRFEVSCDLLRWHWREIIPVMSQIVVVQTVHHWDKDTVEYLAHSDFFEESNPNTDAPWYEFEFSRSLQGPGPIEIIARRRKP